MVNYFLTECIIYLLIQIYCLSISLSVRVLYMKMEMCD